MRKKMIVKLNIFLIAMLMLGCTHSSPKPNQETNSSRVKQVVIDIDKAIAEQKNQQSEALRGKAELLLDSPIYIGDNDEVSFKGDYLKKYSPIKIRFGDNDEVSFKADAYTIPSHRIHNGDVIEMRDKEGKLFLEMEVIK